MQADTIPDGSEGLQMILTQRRQEGEYSANKTQDRKRPRRAGRTIRVSMLPSYLPVVSTQLSQSEHREPDFLYTVGEPYWMW
jgi:hypothetical protein